MRQEDFIKTCSDKKFWQWINNKILIRYEHVPDKKKFLTYLVNQIQNRTYYPNPPKQYLTINKGFGVIRIVPVLRLEDLCVYYYCVNKLEKYIARNRIQGTYGGFGLRGQLRQIEEKEIEQVTTNYGNYSNAFDQSPPYPQMSTVNTKSWYAEWGDFTEKLHANSSQFITGYAA